LKIYLGFKEGIRDHRLSSLILNPLRKSHPQYGFFYGPFKNNRRSFRLCQSNDRFSLWRWVIRA